MVDSNDTYRYRWRLLAASVALIAALGLSLATVRAQAAVADAAELLDARARLTQLFGELDGVQGQLDRTRFDLGALGFELAFADGDEVVAAVHELVRFEPYHGVLRGAAGTLGSGGGNALDQALLTSVLLGDAGFDVVIRGGRLDDAQVGDVLAQMRVVAEARRTPAFDATVDLADAAEAAFLEIEQERATIADRLVDQADRLADALGAYLAFDQADDDLVVEAARWYFWVGYRLGANEPWRAAHPVFGAGGAPFELPAVEVEFVDTVPDEWVHRFRFEVFVERRLGDQIVVEAVTAPWERPVANLYGRVITYANLPDGLHDVDDVSDVAALEAATSFFFPVIDGDVAPGAMAFDMLGIAVPPAAAASPFGPLFQTMGRAASSAAGALAGIGIGREAEPDHDPDAFVSLSAQWIEFTFIAPDGEETVHRRMVVDRRGAAARERGAVDFEAGIDASEAFELLTRSHTIVVAPGAYSDAYRLDATIEGLRAVASYAEEALIAAYRQEPPPQRTGGDGSLDARIAGLGLAGLFDDIEFAGDVVSYRPAPALVVMTEDLAASHIMVDVVANPRWSVRVDASPPRLDAHATFRAGVWETRAEGVAVGSEDIAVVPAFAAFSRPEAAPVRVLTRIDELVDLEVPAETRAALAEDLERGFLVLVPGDLAGATVPAWWRFDARTGETLGRGGDGRGQAATEATMMYWISVGISAGAAVWGAVRCNQISDPRAAGCCHVQNMAGTALGVVGFGALGFALSAKWGVALFLIGDIGYNAAGVFGPTFIC